MRPALLLLALALLVAGCRNQADAGEELSYLRSDPSEYDTPALEARNLLPLKTGARREYQVMTSKGEPYREEMTVVSSNGKQAVIESKAKGKLISRETYLIDSKGIWVTSVLSGTDPVPINPPLPLLPLPVEEGQVIGWQGSIGTGQKTIAGQSWTRVTRRQKITTPAGEFLTYRVDLRTTLGGGVGQNTYLLTSRWFAPGVGIVRTRAIDAKSILVKDLLPQKNANSSVTTEVK